MESFWVWNGHIQCAFRVEFEMILPVFECWRMNQGRRGPGRGSSILRNQWQRPKDACVFLWSGAARELTSENALLE